jgi:tRNA (guanine37-N1)-methyltransferase
MRFDLLSLFPDYFASPFGESILKRAIERGLIEIGLHNIRDYATGKWRKVDDKPFGGGPGMVMMPEPVAKAIRTVKRQESVVVYMSPQGQVLNAQIARDLANSPHLVILCGHYEGVDQRVIDKEVDLEISIGDYVLTDGCLPAIVLINAVSRFIPGVVGDQEGVAQDSFEENRLDWPHYTMPREFEGMEVPEVLLSGNHGKIAAWRRAQALEKTKRVRPDLLQER